MQTTLKALRLAQLLALALIACIQGPALAGTQARAALPVGAPTLDHCSWDQPGVDPFMGDVVAAVDRYVDIAPEVRQRIKARMTRHAYDDVVDIRQSSITGKAKYGSTIRDMHFGANRLCRTVSRARWSEAMQERGLVYCDSGQCILVPTVCRNVSRITRDGVADEHIVAAPPEIESLSDATPPPLLSAPAAATKPTGQANGGSEGEGRAASFESASSGGSGGEFAFAWGGLGADRSQGGSHAPDNTDSATVSVASSANTLAVAPVPEPETWALIAAGLAATTFFARRRAAQAA